MSSRSSTTQSSAIRILRWSAVRSFAIKSLLIAVTVASATPLFAQEGTYQSAKQAMVQGRTEEAIQGLCSLGQYSDAAVLCAQLRAQLANLNRQNEENYQSGVRAFQSGNYAQAQQYFEQVTGTRYDAAQEYLNTRIPAAVKAGAKPTDTGAPQVSKPVAVIPFARDSATRTTKLADRGTKVSLAPPSVRTGAPTAAAQTEPIASVPPATRATTSADVETLLTIGIRAYYGADFNDAEVKLQSYVDGGGQKRGLAEFYLGASKLTRFYLAGAKSEDTALLAEARNAFRLASKVDGFAPPEAYVSPKIVEAYKNSAQ